VGGTFLEEIPHISIYYKKHYKQKQKEHQNYKTGTWNLRTLNQRGKLENLKKEIEQNAVSALGVREGQWKGQGETHSGNYKVYYSGDERDVAIVVHKSTVRKLLRRLCVMTESLLSSQGRASKYFYSASVHAKTGV
jgi:hypothetical protein